MSDPGASSGPVEQLDAQVQVGASAHYRGGMDVTDKLEAWGRYEAVCHNAAGEELWRDTIDNVVATVGKNVMLDAALAGSSYTVVGPYMGLISSVSYGAGPVAGDTMTSHAGWTEAGGTNAPTYTAPRKTMAWSAASGGSKALSAGLTFAFTGAGTIKGAFVVYFTGALSTIDNTAGTLFSAGLFSGGDKVVANTDTVTVTYSVGI